MRQYLYRWLNTSEFRQIDKTYPVAGWVSNPEGTSSQDRFFHVNFQARDYYKTNQELINEIVRVGLELAEQQPAEYGVAPGVLKAGHIEDVAKDLLDSARSGFRQSLRTNPAAKSDEKQRDQVEKEVERSKQVRPILLFDRKKSFTKLCSSPSQKQRHRELGALKLKHPIPRSLLVPGAFSDDAASDDDLHGMSLEEWRAQRAQKLRSDSGLEAITPSWRNPHLTKAYQKADRRSKAKSAVRWRRDRAVNVDVPHTLRGRRLPAALFERNWLAQNRQAISNAPYYITIDEEPVAGWLDDNYPLHVDMDADDESGDMDDRPASKRKRTGTFLDGGAGAHSNPSQTVSYHQDASSAFHAASGSFSAVGSA